MQEQVRDRADTVVLIRAPKESCALIALFEQVASEQGWQAGDHITCYHQASIYFAAYVGQELAGGIQLVLGGSSALLPCLTVWPELNLAGRADVADVALFAFVPAYRGKSGLFWQVLVEVWRYSQAQGIADLYMEITPRILRLYQRLGWPVEVVGPLRPHWGEACYPCRVGVSALEQVFVEKARHAPLFAAVVAQAYRGPDNVDGADPTPEAILSVTP